MRILLIAIVLLLAACELPEEPAWSNAPKTHVCTVDEMTRVQKEAKWCNDNTDYLSTFCYGAAITRICKPNKHIGEKK